MTVRKIFYLPSGEDGVPLSTVVKMVKHAYNYEQWESFDTLIEPAMAALREANDPKFGPDEKALELLVVRHRALAAILIGSNNTSSL